MKKLLLTGIFLLFLYHLSPGQKFENIVAHINNNIVTVSYDLVSPFGIGSYQVDIYSSHNNYSVPLTMVRGDVGSNISSGNRKTISWDIASELGQYDGTMNFELRGRNESRGSQQPADSYSKLSVVSPNAATKYKVGQSYRITWSGGNPNSHVDVDLYNKNDKRHIAKIGTNWPNNGSMAYTFPKTIKGSGKYYIKITDVNNPTQIDQTPYFKVNNPKTTIISWSTTITLLALLLLLSSQGAA